MRTRSTRPSARRATRWFAVALLVLGPVSGCGGGPFGSSRSTDKFCSELRAGNARLKANYEKSTSNPQLKANGMGDLAAIFLNLSEYTRLVHRLDDVAPEAISSDMHDARTVWDKAQDSVGSNGLDTKILSSALMSAIAGNASMNAVDAFSRENCGGKAVFSLNTPASTASPTSGCPDVGFGGTFDPTDPTLGFGDLTSTLEQAENSSDSGLKAASTTLLSALTALTPEPRTAVEALGRLSFDDASGATTLLDDLNQATQGACQSTAVDSNWISGDLKTTVTPRHQDGHLVVGNDYGACDELGWIDSKHVLWCSSSGTLGVLDAEAGAYDEITPDGMTRDTTDESTDDGGSKGAQGDYPTPFLALDGVAWVARSYTPAQGITDPTYTASLHYVALDGSGGFTIPDGSASNDDIGSSWSGSANTLIRRQGPDGSEVSAYDATGTTIWRRNTDGTGDTSFPLPSVLDVGSPQLDLRTGRTLSTGTVVATDSCGESALTDHHIVVQPLGGAPKTVPANPEFVQELFTQYDEVNSAGEVIVTIARDGKGTVNGWSASGAKLWTISGAAVQSFWVLGNQLLVTNTAGDHVVVDARTGKDVTADNTAAADLAKQVGGLSTSTSNSRVLTLLGTAADGSLLLGGSDNDTNGTVVFTAPSSVCSLS